ncbi:Unknown protein sequence [Pseudomonas caricapapayae]|uniref:Uncharacterized protein n=1 Tax=Pseudomonas caricapapayae TaxID=46678 RepID=A0A0P9K2X9_9PSED|nr:hypothetical protein [Pseudomonas caricapapayae]KAA8689561.1 hypothetical protein F4W67_27435 [Pseudomonas caricapapayae]KPW56689.1 Unknown protein sequence [Pseudomonas caricapapayae]RMM09309.1 hypothetical protein ALQ84_03124 [Pseudomonas caricapapayae]
MQLAILLVLILIAVILAPWLFGVIVAAVALYGIWVAVVAVLIVAALLVSSLYASLKKFRSKSRLETQIAEGNRIIAEKERARQA